VLWEPTCWGRSLRLGLWEVILLGHLPETKASPSGRTLPPPKPHSLPAEKKCQSATIRRGEEGKFAWWRLCTTNSEISTPLNFRN